ncbi:MULTISPECIES: hypothetical protein [Lysinibacillus]|uniref:Uncharacterized protein n=1 Tax=Lysinibacillus antri TaxID=2498145 RepID=A0A3S0RUJ7_9BACI|nr:MULTISPECIES: hypothetical protein [Lysinibacillus]RUL50308.1 hypothetical protein EK386_14105 [Lysinibacillus antri]TSI08271.1 hypothetical protein FJQ64_07160 [Lysinibacillus sp. BW-2-10]
MTKTLEQLHSNISSESKKGFPILLSGSIIFLLFTFMPLLFPMSTVYLIWIFGLGAIFPFGIVLSKLFGINILSTKNPLGVLGGIIAAPQAFFIPVFIIVYMHIPEYLPFTIGLLGGSHFLPYMWIYKSKAYLFVTLGTCLSSLIIGGFFVDMAFTLVPLAICLVYAMGVFLILKELKSEFS